jgi:hypothetical protein
MSDLSFDPDNDPEQVLRMKRRNNNQCFLCGAKLNEEELEICLDCYIEERSAEYQ